MMDSETRELVLANRSFLWGLLARAYAEEADEAFLQTLQSEHAHDEVHLLSDERSAAIGDVYARICEKAAAPDALSDIRHEYVALFIGPEAPKAAPWESVQRTNKPVLFQKGILEVRDAYREAGFLPVRYPRVADDFIGIECDFMAKLAETALSFQIVGDDEKSRIHLENALRFLNEHLGVWAQTFADATRENYGDCFFADIADLLVLVISRDKETLTTLLEDGAGELD